MSSRTAWALAYHAQAKADLDAAGRLGNEPASVVCMLLQMAYEKLAKAALLLTHDLEIDKATASHFAVGRLLDLLKRERDRPTLAVVIACVGAEVCQ